MVNTRERDNERILKKKTRSMNCVHSGQLSPYVNKLCIDLIFVAR